jgi:hypothetical protein
MKALRSLILLAAVALFVLMTAPTTPAYADQTTVKVPYLAAVAVTTGAHNAPSHNSNNVGTLVAGQTWFLLGTDATGNWVCFHIPPLSSGWVPISTFALNGVKLPIASSAVGGPVIAPAAPAPAPSIPVTVKSGSSALVTVIKTTSVYAGPNNNVVGKIYAGQTFFVLGIDSTGGWVKVQIMQYMAVWAPSSALDLSMVILPVTK